MEIVLCCVVTTDRSVYLIWCTEMMVICIKQIQFRTGSVCYIIYIYITCYKFSPSVYVNV